MNLMNVYIFRDYNTYVHGTNLSHLYQVRLILKLKQYHLDLLMKMMIRSFVVHDIDLRGSQKVSLSFQCGRLSKLDTKLMGHLDQFRKRQALF